MNTKCAHSAVVRYSHPATPVILASRPPKPLHLSGQRLSFLVEGTYSKVKIKEQERIYKAAGDDRIHIKGHFFLFSQHCLRHDGSS